ncbi:DinB family protein [Lutibacter flavus]|uniref:DinB-like domain-containing protein n=1 Tax=Lutibacter flavus TaxID=691689 RepID=A0A238W138_9FLAO|nr:DinB family protein [Lutibacter flavus]SNR39429.1 hypothetical protein SAMN04488111_1198 [Lutibacter flavus]
MKQAKQISNRFREVILNGKWVSYTNYKDQLLNLTWKQANKKIESLNTISDLVFHINYYIAGVLNVFEGGPLDIRDKYSFNSTPIKSQNDWEELINTLWNNAEKFANLIESMPEKKLDEIFVDKKYGNYQRNINGIIEHSYYHLGQITLIKKMVLESEKQG